LARTPKTHSRVARSTTGRHALGPRRSERSFAACARAFAFLDAGSRVPSAELTSRHRTRPILHYIGRHLVPSRRAKPGCDVAARRSSDCRPSTRRSWQGRIRFNAGQRRCPISPIHSTDRRLRSPLGRSAEAVEHDRFAVGRRTCARRGAAAHLPQLANLGCCIPRSTGRAVPTLPMGLTPPEKSATSVFQSRSTPTSRLPFAPLDTTLDDEGGARRVRGSISIGSVGLLDHLAVPLIVLGQIHQCHGDTTCARYY